MGILNITPDSFSDGGKYLSTSRAIDRAFEMVDDGADIIDIGGESTRPGSKIVKEKEILRSIIQSAVQMSSEAYESKEESTTILDHAEYSDLMAGDGYTSSGAIYSLLRYKPTHITVMDEFGKRLESISKSSNSNKEDALQILMETWGRCHGVLRPDNYSMMTLTNKQQKEVLDRSTIKPAITLVGMSVPKNFYGALSTGRIVDGFLNRFIVVEFFCYIFS